MDFRKKWDKPSNERLDGHRVAQDRCEGQQDNVSQKIMLGQRCPL
jgi:hypothetical protein